MSIDRLYLPVIEESEWNRAHGISDRLCEGERVSKTDNDFHDWYNSEAQRQAGLSGEMKSEGWNEFHGEAAGVEARADGLEKVIYAHWWRACAGDQGAMLPREYAGHWLHAQRNQRWCDDDAGKLIFVLLCSRYPIPRKPRLRDGYSYLWIEDTPTMPKPRASTKSAKAKIREGGAAK